MQVIMAAPPVDTSLSREETPSIERMLREQEKSFVTSVSDRLDGFESWRFWLNLVLVVGGAAAAGVGRWLDAKDVAGPWSTLTVVGITFAVVGGSLTAIIDRRRSKLIGTAGDTLSLARRVIDERQSLRREIDLAEGRDARRRFFLRAERLMREASLQMPLSAPLETVCQTFTDTALEEIRGAIGFEPGERWSLSIFLLSGRDGEEVMFPVVVEPANRSVGERAPRMWKSGEGYSGTAWRDDKEVIEADATSPDIARRYELPPDQRRDHDGDYVSVVAVPFRASVMGPVIGVVTMTSNKSGRFKSDPKSTLTQYVDTVRAIAGILAVQAHVRDFRALPEVEGREG